MQKKRYLFCALIGVLMAVVVPLQAGAGSTRKATAVIWGGKNDCGSSTKKGFTRSGKTTFVRSGANMTVSFSVTGLSPSTEYFAEVHADGDCNSWIYALDVNTDANGNASSTGNTFPTATGHSQFFQDFRLAPGGHPGTIASAGTNTVTLP